MARSRDYSNLITRSTALHFLSTSPSPLLLCPSRFAAPDQPPSILLASATPKLDISLVHAAFVSSWPVCHRPCTRRLPASPLKLHLYPLQSPSKSSRVFIDYSDRQIDTLIRFGQGTTRILSSPSADHLFIRHTTSYRDYISHKQTLLVCTHENSPFLLSVNIWAGLKLVQLAYPGYQSPHRAPGLGIPGEQEEFNLNYFELDFGNQGLLLRSPCILSLLCLRQHMFSSRCAVASIRNIFTTVRCSTGLFAIGADIRCIDARRSSSSCYI